jgi:hypothetical protein
MPVGACRFCGSFYRAGVIFLARMQKTAGSIFSFENAHTALQGAGSGQSPVVGNLVAQLSGTSEMRKSNSKNPWKKRILADYFHPVEAIFRLGNAICVESGKFFGQTSWQANSAMQPKTPSSSPISS